MLSWTSWWMLTPHKSCRTMGCWLLRKGWRRTHPLPLVVLDRPVTVVLSSRSKMGCGYHRRKLLWNRLLDLKSECRMKIRCHRGSRRKITLLFVEKSVELSFIRRWKTSFKMFQPDFKLMLSDRVEQCTGLSIFGENYYKNLWKIFYCNNITSKLISLHLSLFYLIFLQIFDQKKFSSPPNDVRLEVLCHYRRSQTVFKRSLKGQEEGVMIENILPSI